MTFLLDLPTWAQGGIVFAATSALIAVLIVLENRRAERERREREAFTAHLHSISEPRHVTIYRGRAT